MAALPTVRLFRAGACPPVRLTAAWQRDPGGRLVCAWTRPVPADGEDPLS